MQSLPVATSRTYDVGGSCTGMIIHRMRRSDLGANKPRALTSFSSVNVSRASVVSLSF